MLATVIKFSLLQYEIWKPFFKLVVFLVAYMCKMHMFNSQYPSLKPHPLY